MKNDKKNLNAFALVGFVLGLLSVLLYWVIGIIPILAIVFSIIGLVSVKNSGQKGKGFAITGLVLGIVYVLAFGLNIYLNNYFGTSNVYDIVKTQNIINEKLIGTWEGSHVNQYSDGTSGMVPGRIVEIYTLQINQDNTFSLKKFFGLYEQKNPNESYSATLSNTHYATGKIIVKNNTSYLQIKTSDINGYGLKAGDETLFQISNNNTATLILPEKDITFYK